MLKGYFYCDIYCGAHLGTPWYQIAEAFRAVSNRESQYPRWNLPISKAGNLRTFNSAKTATLQLYYLDTIIRQDGRVSNMIFKATT